MFISFLGLDSSLHIQTYVTHLLKPLGLLLELHVRVNTPSTGIHCRGCVTLFLVKIMEDPVSKFLIKYYSVI